MRIFTFAVRNTKEILRDPLNIAFGLGFPFVLIFLLSAIQANIPVKLFEIQTLAPGVAVFGLSFMTLFSATVISKDRGSCFAERLYTTPLKPIDFILGYTLPIIPISLAQSVLSFAASTFFGLHITVNVLYALLFIIPISLFYIALGLLCGSVFTDKQVGGVCGALLTNLSAWLSGVWFDLELVGGTFKKIAHVFPFYHAVELERVVISGEFSRIFAHIWWVIGYTVFCFAAAVLFFLRQMKRR